MLTHLDPTSTLAVGLLIFALAMVLMFEATNGFHDAAECRGDGYLHQVAETD